jgi:hypothetical protein
MHTGHFTARLNDTTYELELELDATGCLSGGFTVGHEQLEVMGGVPNAFGEVFGLIREPGGDTQAVFRALPQADDVLLEVDVPDGGRWQVINAQRMVFVRQAESCTPGRELPSQTVFSERNNTVQHCAVQHSTVQNGALALFGLKGV